MQLFDRPLRRDVLLQVWAVVVGLTTLSAARGKVDVGAPFNADRAAAFVVEALGGAVAALLAVLFTALVRRLVREERADGAYRHEAPTAGGGSVPGSLRRRFGRRDREWTDAEALRTDVGEASGGTDRPRRAPYVTVSLDSVSTIVGLPVELEWQAPDADHVLVSVLDGPQPSSGTAPLHLEHGTDITVTAVNEFGSRTVRTPYVQVLPLPTLTAMAVPQTPRLALSADVAVAVGLGAPALRRLDAVLDEQAELRAARSVQAVTLMTPLHRVRAAAATAAGWRPSGPVWEAVVREERWARCRRAARACRHHGHRGAVATRAWSERLAADLRRGAAAGRDRLRQLAAGLRLGAADLLARARLRLERLPTRSRSAAPPVPPLTTRLETYTSVPSQPVPSPAPSAGADAPRWWTPPPTSVPPTVPNPPSRWGRS